VVVPALLRAPRPPRRCRLGGWGARRGGELGGAAPRPAYCRRCARRRCRQRRRPAARAPPPARRRQRACDRASSVSYRQAGDAVAVGICPVATTDGVGEAEEAAADGSPGAPRVVGLLRPRAPTTRADAVFAVSNDELYC